jgi:hypothetical protein
MAVNITLIDRDGGLEHRLGRFNEGRATKLQILRRAFHKKNLGRLGCVTNWSLRIENEEQEIVPLAYLRDCFLREDYQGE